MDEETSSEKEKRIAHLAERAFSGHVLTQEGEGRWVCRTPGSSFHLFRITALPVSLLVDGDIGVSYYAIYSNPVRWLLGAIDSMDYVLGKVRAVDHDHAACPWDRRKEFRVGDARLYLAERLAEYEDDEDGNPYPQRRRELLKVQEDFEKEIRWNEEAPHQAWTDAWTNNGFSCDDFSPCSGWSTHLLWHYNALKVFVRLFQGEPLPMSEVAERYFEARGLPSFPPPL